MKSQGFATRFYVQRSCMNTCRLIRLARIRHCAARYRTRIEFVSRCDNFNGDGERVLKNLLDLFFFRPLTSGFLGGGGGSPQI